MMKKIFLILVSVGLLLGCSKDDEDSCNIKVDTSNVDAVQLELDIATIDAYLEGNDIVAIKHESGLRYVISTSATGNNPNNCAQVKVNYSGTLLSDGSEFDANDQAVFYLSGLIIGWRIGFTELKKGESATLYIPSGLAYGASSRDGIPANSNLVFEVDLVDFLNL